MTDYTRTSFEYEPTTTTVGAPLPNVDKRDDGDMSDDGTGRLGGWGRYPGTTWVPVTMFTDIEAAFLSLRGAVRANLYFHLDWETGEALHAFPIDDDVPGSMRWQLAYHNDDVFARFGAYVTEADRLEVSYEPNAITRNGSALHIRAVDTDGEQRADIWVPLPFHIYIERRAEREDE